MAQSLKWGLRRNDGTGLRWFARGQVRFVVVCSDRTRNALRGYGWLSPYELPRGRKGFAQIVLPEVAVSRAASLIAWAPRDVDVSQAKAERQGYGERAAAE
ncbi:MAG: hypothetical protein N2515_10950, partial [Deltaproteobacteria bacterium]|nr:hypothetical protein [Deltaproteobacteria bacterium]